MLTNLRAMAVWLAVLCVPCAQAAEPECIPGPGGAGVDLRFGFSLNGMWGWWWCPRSDGMEYRVRYVGTWAQTMRMVGDRIDTIRKAADPLAAARAAHKRYATLLITDPALAAVYADYLADLKASQP